MNKKDDFDLLREKLFEDKPQNMDSLFWKEFKAQFPLKEEKPPLWEKYLSYLAPLSLALLIIFTINLQQYQLRPLDIQQISQNQELLENLDLYSDVLEDGVLDLTEEEWDVLLDGRV